MFLRLRRRGIELEEKTASKSVSKWPRESLLDSRNYIMALRAFKIVASRLCFFGGHTVYMFLRLRRRGIELEEKTASKSVSKWLRESLRDSRNYIMALRAFKIVASRLCFFWGTPYTCFCACGAVE